MPKNYISPISMDALSNLCSELDKNNWIKPNDYQKYHVKRMGAGSLPFPQRS